MLPSCLSDPYSPIHVGQGCVSGIGNAVLPGNAPKTKKIMYDLLDNEEFDREEIPTYEDVARLFPRPGVFRPIVMIGPPGVGRNELKRRLMAMEPERCKATIPRKFLKSIYGKFISAMFVVTCKGWPSRDDSSLKQNPDNIYLVF